MSSEEQAQSGGSPCQQCGACCAAFRVSFYWSEAGTLPAAKTERLGPLMACMAGTNSSTPYCAALTGVLGQQVQCIVYDQRPSPCREVEPGDDKCTRARARYGLAPLASATT